MLINTKNMEFSQAEQEQFADNENVLAVSKRLMEKNQKACQEPAK